MIRVLLADDHALVRAGIRALVEKLIQGGIVKASELGKIIVEREEETPTPAGPVSTTPTDEKRSQAQGGGS